MELTYSKCGDYLIPDLVLSDTKEYHIGKYGRLRRAYLKPESVNHLGEIFSENLKILCLWRYVFLQCFHPIVKKYLESYNPKTLAVIRFLAHFHLLGSRIQVKEHRPILYTDLIVTEKLFPHLEEIDIACRERLEIIEKAMMQQEGVTETLKTADQMAWVRSMNSIHNRAEEIVLAELVYC